MPPEIRAAILRIISYNWIDEQDDYEQCSDEPGGNSREGHIFKDLQRVRHWLLLES